MSRNLTKWNDLIENGEADYTSSCRDTAFLRGRPDFDLRLPLCPRSMQSIRFFFSIPTGMKQIAQSKLTN